MAHRRKQNNKGASISENHVRVSNTLFQTNKTENN